MTVKPYVISDRCVSPYRLQDREDRKLRDIFYAAKAPISLKDIFTLLPLSLDAILGPKEDLIYKTSFFIYRNLYL